MKKYQAPNLYEQLDIEIFKLLKYCTPTEYLSDIEQQVYNCNNFEKQEKEIRDLLEHIYLTCSCNQKDNYYKDIMRFANTIQENNKDNYVNYESIYTLYIIIVNKYYIKGE